nr:hypothetical protein [Okeania sp. SIO2F4]
MPELLGFSTPLEADKFLKSKGVDLDYDEEDFISCRKTGLNIYKNLLKVIVNYG